MPGTELRLQFDINGRMLLATLAVTAFTALVFGLYPAWRASRMDTAPALKEGSRNIGGKLLVSAQVALAVLLVAAAAFFTSHLRNILSSDTGFERTRLLMFDVRPGESGYQGQRLRQLYLDLEQSLRRLPGVEAVALNQIRPMKSRHWHTVMSADGTRRIGSPGLNFVTVDYLRTLGVPMLAGRGISEYDIRSKAHVAVVSEEFAKALGGTPLGSRFMMGDKPYQVIGVAARARYDRLTAQPQVLYLPNSLDYGSATVLLRTSVPPMQVLGAVRETVRELDRDLPVAAVLTMEQQIAESLRRERLFAWLCGSFGVLALALCMIGLYGVMSYSAARRSQEMGIRMVLGASPRDVLRHVIGEGMAVAACGLLTGAPVAYLAARKYVDYRSLGMQPLDGAIIAWTLAGLATAALLAVLAPALRAAWSDPVKALRQG
jgi:predicted permease